MNKLALKLPGSPPIEINSPSYFEFADKTIGDVLTALLPYIFVLAGIILFGYLIMGGFAFLTSAGDPEKIKTAQKKLVNAIIGFVIIFAAYWLVQILEEVLGIGIFQD
jgi:hypothetical protein